MQKYTLRLCIGSAVLAAFGGFLRWMQNQVSFEKDTGLAVRGSIWPYMLALWLIVGAVYLAVVIIRMQRKGNVRLPMTFAAAFRPNTLLTPLLSLVIGLLMLAGGMMLILRTPLAEPQRKLLIILGGIAAFTGVTYPVYLLRAGEEDPPSVVRPILGSMPILLYAFWLVVSYKMHIVNPTISSYALEIITIAAAAVACFRMAGFAFENPKPGRALFWGSWTAFLCMLSMADSRYLGAQLILIATAGMLLLQVWLISMHGEKQ